MRLVKSIRTHRQRSHLNTRLELRDERTYFRIFLKWLAPIYVVFAFVDSLTTGASFWGFLTFRLGMVALATLSYLLLRGRVRYDLRLFFLTAPYVFSVEYLMIHHSLTLSPYFAGFALVMFVSTIFFPMRLRAAAPHHALCVVPIVFWYALHPLVSRGDTVNVLLMSIGTALVCAANASQLNSDLRRRLIAQEILARDLGKRQKEVWEKAGELVRRKAFESQFSPQVVSAVLHQGSAAIDMRQQDVVIVVIDVVGSTQKATTLPPADYKEVIEEVFDVFSSACLRWNVTVDKFTGDGAQAFAGAPVSAPDDLARALMSARDTLQMLAVRSFTLRRRWREVLRVRTAVCEGRALVGFLGRGSLKSFTALGDSVSFAHRLCAAGEPGKVSAYSRRRDIGLDPPEADWHVETREISGLKGFEGRSFKVNLLEPMSQHPTRAILVDNGRCPNCRTPLILDETPTGLPKLVCPGCVARTGEAA